MLDVLFNPPNIEAIYLGYFNQCFEHWGNADMFRWCFERRVGNLQADLMLIQNEGNVIAGSAVTYRTISLANKTMNVGIMTGSWTLPQARGQGCFTRIIQESVKLAADKGAGFLLAFVTESNASFRRLAAAGSALFPTHYIFSNDQTPIPQKSMSVSLVENRDRAIETILGRLASRQAGTGHFTYTPEEWRTQFIERTSQIELVEIGTGSFAVIEKHGDFDRALVIVPNASTNFSACVQSLLKQAQENRRKLFLFTTSIEWHNDCVNLGMGHAPGFLTALPANTDTLKQINPNLGIIPTNITDLLYQPKSDWYIGDWDIQSGDRM